MEQFQISSPEDFGKLFNYRRENLKDVMTKEVQEAIDNEFGLTELNLFISSVGKEKIKEATKKVKELRARVDMGEVDLTEYENLAEEF